MTLYLFRTNSIRRAWIGFVVITSIFLGSWAHAEKLSAEGKASFMRLAENIPAAATYSLLVGDLRGLVVNSELILKKYQQSDPTFQFDKFILSVKGSLGYNPFSPSEIMAMGIDLDYGVAVFSLSDKSTPIIIAKALDANQAAKSVENMAEQLGQAKPCTDRVFGGATVRYFTKSGTQGEKPIMAYARRGNMIYVMAEPPDETWFTRHLKVALDLTKAESMANEKSFSSMLGRLEAKTSLVVYNNYAQYLKTLKENAKELRSQIETRMPEEKKKSIDTTAPLAFLDTIAEFAGGFNAQIFAISLQSDKLTFAHELVGNKKRVDEFAKLFAVSGETKLNQLDLSGDIIGSLLGNINGQQFASFLSKKNPTIKKRLDRWRSQLQEEAGLSFDKDILENINGEMAALFYGINTLPKDIVYGQGMTELQIASQIKLVFAVVIKDAARTKGALKQAEGILQSKGKAVTSFDERGEKFLEVSPDGVPLQFGVYKNYFLLGFGKDALKTALSGTDLKLPVAKDILGQLKFNLQKFVPTMESFKPPLDSPNTQLHQQYKVWKEQAAPKVNFVKGLDARAVKLPDGFSTRGEIRF